MSPYDSNILDSFGICLKQILSTSRNKIIVFWSLAIQ